MQHEQERSGDYGYDTAHELNPDDVRGHAAAHERQTAVYVATTSEDHDQDYSYDLAHDIPPMRRE
jgi:hypothetical protein